MKLAEERIAGDRARALGSLRPAAAEAAAAIVERLIGAKVSAEDAARIIGEQQAPV
jgi:F0F1-type ATP synthase membrane subunit b/b'